MASDEVVSICAYLHVWVTSEKNEPQKTFQFDATEMKSFTNVHSVKYKSGIDNK